MTQGAMRTYLRLFLLVLAPSVLLGQTLEERKRNFINQHVKQHMSENRCDSEMGSRYITDASSNQCKDANTFIRAGTNLINAVCHGAGTPYNGSAHLRRSNQPFTVVKCKLKNNQRYPRCEYRGRAPSVYIIIGCEGGFPVHYQGDIPNISS